MKKVLSINDYADEIGLFDEYIPILSGTESKEDLVTSVLTELVEPGRRTLSYEEKRRLLHGKINTLPPHILSREGMDHLNRLLQLELLEKDITTGDYLLNKSTKTIGKTAIAVWQGDITTLAADAIVNAANSQLLGCWQPLHACIDNAIHTAAGVQLRDDCRLIMEKQGFAEPTASAKITRAYNLPSKFILHTVGPIVQALVTEQNRNDLAKAYHSCLEVGKQVEDIKSLAFCGISTGVFGYPPEEAAKLAFMTVTDWLLQNPECLDLVIFNVFSNNDKVIYEKLVKNYD